MSKSHPSLAARTRRIAGLLVLASAASGCVTRNATTGQPVPRGDQRYPFAKVEKAAADLEVGMTKYDVLYLLGSPAERDETGDVWVYLPERYGVLLPARALRVEFENGRLKEHGFRPIVLGAQL